MKGCFERRDNVDFIIDFVCDYKGDNVVDFNNKDKADVNVARYLPLQGSKCKSNPANSAYVSQYYSVIVNINQYN